MMVSPVTVRSWAQKGLLVAKVTPGGHRRFLKSDVERFVRESAAIYADVKSFAPRVLIVDDDPMITAYIHNILEDSKLGFVTEIAKSSFEAGLKIHPFAPDVVLLNFMRPEIDAYRICSFINSDAAMRHICVIAIAVDVSAENVTRILAAGAVTILEKPFSPQDLLEVLSQAAVA
ncbi:MAG: response regulator [Methylomicrobium sp.]|nr:response regulator [Methylomicrobium sp.]